MHLIAFSSEPFHYDFSDQFISELILLRSQDFITNQQDHPNSLAQSLGTLLHHENTLEHLTLLDTRSSYFPLSYPI